MNFAIEFEQEDDGRWLAEVVDLPGVLVYGQTREAAVAVFRPWLCASLPSSLSTVKALPTW